MTTLSSLMHYCFDALMKYGCYELQMESAMNNTMCFVIGHCSILASCEGVQAYLGHIDFATSSSFGCAYSGISAAKNEPRASQTDHHIRLVTEKVAKQL
jgi:hypothetical protein